MLYYYKVQEEMNVKVNKQTECRIKMTRILRQVGTKRMEKRAEERKNGNKL